jgi:hypothetical protein
MVVSHFSAEVLVKRFAAIWMMAVGLLVAGGANAGPIGAFNVDCAANNPSFPQVQGYVGDYFTLTITGGTCLLTDGGSPSGVTWSTGGSPNPSSASSGSTVTVTLSVDTGGGTFFVSGNAGDIITYIYLPTVTSISPTSGSTAGGDTITITGTGFSGASGITVGGNPCQSTSFPSATSATCVTPPGSAGTASVVITDANGFTNVANTLFTYQAPASTPTVTSISPTSGSTAGGDTITITGTDLTGATSITVGGAACAPFNVASATSATCTTPAGTAGTASVEVTTPGGTSASNSLFTYTAAPTPTPTPSAVPSLSEWAQMLLGLMVMMLFGWHFHRERSY